MTTMTLRDARADYYRANNFGDDGGDSLAWVPLKIWKLTLKIPNSNARRAAVKIHDLHHVATGYQTDLTGEAEIGAWEIGSGCTNVPVAFVLNMFAVWLGMIIAPIRTSRAFARGCATKNLYGRDVDAMLGDSVETVQTKLSLDEPRPPTRATDVLAMAGLAMFAQAIIALPFVVAICAIAWIF